MSEPNSQEFGKDRLVVEVRQKEDIPLRPNEFLFNSSQLDELKGVNTIVMDTPAATFYKVTNESENGKLVKPYEMAALDTSKFTDSLLVYNKDFTNKFLGVVLGQIKNDITVTTAAKTFVDFKMWPPIRLARDRRIMVNNIKSAENLLKKLDEIGATKGDEFKGVISGIREQIAGARHLFTKGQEMEAQITTDPNGEKKFVFKGKDEAANSFLELKDVNLSFQEIRYRDGSLFAKGDTAARKRSGPWEWYRKDGSLQRKGSYHLASRTGEWTWYDRGGNVTKTVDYGDKTKK